MPICGVCGKEFKTLNKNHISTHGLSIEEYTERYGTPYQSKRHGGSSTSSIKSKMETAEDFSAHRKKILEKLYEDSKLLELPDYTIPLFAGDEGKLEKIVESISSVYRDFELDLETSSLDPFTGFIVGVVVTLHTDSYKDNYYIPTHHVDPVTEIILPGQMETSYVLSKLKPLVEDNKIRKVYHNSRFDCLFLLINGIDVFKGWNVYDTLSSMHVLNENLESFKLKDLIPQFYEDIQAETKIPFQFEVEKYEDVFEKVNIRYSPINIGTKYAAKDGLSTRVLREFQEPYIESIGGLKRVHEMEHKLLPVLIDMRSIGIRADRDKAAELALEFRRELEEAGPILRGNLGDINLNSPKQLSGVLYDELGLPDITGKRKTDKATLEELADLGVNGAMREIVDQLLVYRGHGKILGTYLDGIDQYINPVTQKVHAQFNPTGARTGRFSSSGPNLQNLPKRDKRKKRVRRVYTADPGEVLMSSDYSQVEPRLTAEIAKEDNMIKAFLEDRDLYTEMASLIFKKPAVECGEGSDLRQKTKTLWLAMLYGMTDKGLAARLMIRTSEAKEIMHDFFEAFPGIKEAMNHYQRKCRNEGYVETLLGRKRRLPDIWSDEWWIRESVKRKILNSVIQGTAADVMKMAMINIGTDKRIRDIGGRLLVTVHDEVIVSSPKESAVQVAKYVVEDMVKVGPELGITKVSFKCDCELFLDGRWASEHSLKLKKILSSEVKPEEIDWRV